MSKVVAVVSRASAADAVGDLGEGVDVIVVGPTSAEPSAVDHRIAMPPRGRLSGRIVELAWRSAVGRNAIRVTPLDDSRRLWRAARKDRELRELIRSADVVLAADRDAIFTVWKMTRSRSYGAGWSAVFGAAAARFALTGR